jgi:hypothetical protein
MLNTKIKQYPHIFKSFQHTFMRKAYGKHKKLTIFTCLKIMSTHIYEKGIW